MIIYFNAQKNNKGFFVETEKGIFRKLKIADLFNKRVKWIILEDTWVDEIHGGKVRHKYRCPVCGNISRWARPYCDNCGSYMKGWEHAKID